MVGAGAANRYVIGFVSYAIGNNFVVGNVKAEAAAIGVSSALNGAALSNGCAIA